MNLNSRYFPIPEQNHLQKGIDNMETAMYCTGMITLQAKHHHHHPFFPLF